jgi:hypothetical protein
VRITFIVAALFIVGFSAASHASNSHSAQKPLLQDLRAFVTGYNTVAGQTDDTPCIAASLAYICGRTDAVACPRHISLGTYLEIRGAIYVCEDRLAKKYDARFDISCDKDTDCPGKVTGWTVIRVLPNRRPVSDIAPTGFFSAGKCGTALATRRGREARSA